MGKRKIIASLLLSIGVLLSIAFLLQIDFPQGFEVYFERAYYSQFGPLVISIELLTASYYLFIEHKNTNLALAIFGFTGLLDPILTKLGYLNSSMPLYGTIIIAACALLCLWLAFSNTFKLSPMTLLKITISVIIGFITEIFFNL